MPDKSYGHGELAQGGNTPYEFGKAVGEAARQTFCFLQRDYPGFVREKLGLRIPGFDDAAQGISDALCPLPEEQPDEDRRQPWTGGQCPNVAYRVNWTAEIEFTTPPSVQPVSGFSDFTGTINGSKKTESQGIILFTPPSGVVTEFAATGATPPAARVKSFSIVSVVRLDGLPDNCGNPPDFPDLTPPPTDRTDEAPLPIPVPNPNKPPVIVPVPIILKPNVDIDININIGSIPIDVNINLGGVDVRLPGGLPGGGAVDLTPVIDKVDNLDEKVELQDEKLDSLLTEQLILKDNQITIATCTNGVPTQLSRNVKSIGNRDGEDMDLLFDTLFAELYLLRTEGIINCKSNFSASSLFSGTMTEEESVIISALQQPDDVYAYELKILEFDSLKSRIYKFAPDEQDEVGFGNFGIVTSDDAYIGSRVDVFLRKTVILAEGVRVPHAVRVSLKPGAEFEVIKIVKSI